MTRLPLTRHSPGQRSGHPRSVRTAGQTAQPPYIGLLTSEGSASWSDEDVPWPFAYLDRPFDDLGARVDHGHCPGPAVGNVNGPAVGGDRDARRVSADVDGL